MRDNKNQATDVPKDHNGKGNGFLATSLKVREGLQVGNVEIRISGIYSNQAVIVVKAPREIKISKLDRID